MPNLNINKATSTDYDGLDDHEIDIQVMDSPKDQKETEWINTRAPEAAKYKWEKTGVYINTPTFIRKVHTFQKLLKSKIGVNKKYAMGPSEYWFKTNKYLKEFTNKHFNLNIFRLDHWSELKKDATNLFEHGSSTEKRQVLTLLEALKMYLD